MFKTDLNKGMGEPEGDELDLIKSEAIASDVLGKLQGAVCKCPDGNTAGHGCVVR